jgi:hypothetical protein
MNHPRSEKLVSKQTILQYSEEDLRGVVKAYPPPLGFLLPTFTMSHFLAISSPLLSSFYLRKKSTTPACGNLCKKGTIALLYPAMFSSS